MRYAVTHETRYAYRAPVEVGLHVAKLMPLQSERQQVIDQHLDISPTPTGEASFRDHFGNGATYIAIETPHDVLSVTLRATVEVKPVASVAEAPSWETVRDAMKDDGFPACPDVAEFLYPSPLAPANAAAVHYVAGSFTAKRPIAEAALGLARRIRKDFAYTPGATTIATPVADVIAHHRGVCQDFAHVMIAGLRGLGLPARYVSGYLRTYPPKEAAAAERRGFDASHAWVSVWCGTKLGWLDFDPTNALLVSDEHITVAHGRDFADVTPLRGVITGGGQHRLSVAVTVEPLPEEATAAADESAPDGETTSP